MKISKCLDPNLIDKFAQLRAQTFNICLSDIWNRIEDQKKIIPTKEERHINSIWQLIEPQVRNAVKELNKKGYTTMDSGFWGETGKYQKQFIRGRFVLDEATINLLAHKEVHVENEGIWTMIWFFPKNPDLDEIKHTWNEIVTFIPDLGHYSKTLDEIFHFNEDKIMQKLFELGKITKEDYKTFKKNKKPRPGKTKTR